MNVTSKDHAYYVAKLEEKERELEVYRECFLEVIKWFHVNRKLIKTIPVSHKPKVPDVKKQQTRYLLQL